MYIYYDDDDDDSQDDGHGHHRPDRQHWARGVARRRVCNTINTGGLTGKTLQGVVSKPRIGGCPVR